MQQRQHIERIIIIIIIKRDLERSEEAYTCFWACNDITLSPKLKTGYRNENQFRTRVSRMSLSSFVDINIFVLKYYVFQFLYILHFVESLKSKSSQMLTPQKGNWMVSFNDTFLNSGLCRVCYFWMCLFFYNVYKISSSV